MLLRGCRCVVTVGLLISLGTSSGVSQLAPKPPTDQEVSGGFWRVDHTFQSTLRIKNDLAASSLIVRPALFMADGAEYDLQEVEIPQSGEVNVNINDALKSAPSTIVPHVSLFGTAAVRLSHAWKPVEASIENLDTPRSLIFDYHMTNSLGTSSGDHTFQGLWWKSFEQTGGFLALSNIGNDFLIPEYEVQGRSGEDLSSGSVKLAPHTTEVLDLKKLIPNVRDDETRAGGITIHYRGQDGALAIAGGLEQDEIGFSSVLPFLLAHKSKDEKPANVALASVGLMVGKPDPMQGFPEQLRFSPYATLRNNGDNPLSVVIAGNYMNGPNPRTLALGKQQLRPHETVQLKMNEMLATAGLSHFDGMLNLSFSYEGFENDLLVGNGSIDQTGNYVFAVLPLPLGASAGRQANYWSVENGFDTMISLWNPSGQPEDLLLSLYYPDGSGN